MARARFACAVRYSRTLRFLEDGLLRLIGGALCTFGIDLFRVLGGVYKHEDIVALDLHHALGTAAVRHSLPGAR